MKFFPFGLGNDNYNKEFGAVELLGGKGAGLVWLSTQGVPVPPGFIIPTDVWAEYDKKPKSTMKLIAKELPQYLEMLKAHFGYMPLLSVRSGARVSCPGMMDTILNVGIDGKTYGWWQEKLGSDCFEDSFHRLVTMYGSVVKDIRKESMGSTLSGALESYNMHTGTQFPDAQTQLLGAIEAVFKSWDNDRANEYRRIHGYDREWGTAVTVQAMVFGNLNDQSGTGVLFTRNPDTGAAAVTGEWLPNAQGEDIVAGVRTPLPLPKMMGWNEAVYVDLMKQVLSLEEKRRDMLDIEFTIQDGKLYLLQVRNGKRSATAAIRIAVDMAKEELITPKVAVTRVTPKQFDLAQMVTLDPKWTKKAAFVGIPACSGVVTGKPVFTKADAINCKEPCILVTHETTPDDIAGMEAAKGVITMVGGATSHAAVVARGMNKVCIVGVGQDIESFKDIEVLSMVVDADAGRIWTEKVPTVGGTINGVITEFNKLVCDTLGVVPVIFEAPLDKMPEALLYLGDQILDQTKATNTVVAALHTVDRLYLDLVPSKEEMRYLGIVSAHKHAKRLVELLESALTEHEVSRVVLVCEESMSGKFQQMLSGGDLRSLVLAEQEIVLGSLDVQDVATQKVLEWKMGLGVKMVSLGNYLDGHKSMVSVQQALQIVSGW